MSTLDSHDQDFYAWAMKSAEFLRQGRIADLDIEHLAEEIEDMEQRRKLMALKIKSWFEML